MALELLSSSHVETRVSAIKLLSLMLVGGCAGCVRFGARLWLVSYSIGGGECSLGHG